MSNPKFDLHFHSSISDGKLSVAELAEIIKNERLEFCSLVDHNSVDGIKELEQLLKGTNTKVISGTELTAKYNEDEVHILAYDLDIEKTDEVLKERNDLVRKQKLEEMAESIKLTKLAGLNITEDLTPDEKQPVTLTTAMDICSKRSNQDMFLTKFGKELTPEDIYYEYQAPGKSCAVIRSGVTVEWLVEKFTNIAKDLIIAHPFVSVSVVVKPLNETRITNLINLGITGIEVYHKKTSDEQIEFLKNFVKKYNLNYTGGSDFHNPTSSTQIGYFDKDRVILNFNLANYS